MPSRRSRREKNRAKKITKLNDDCCVGESQDVEERDSFQEAHEKKKTCNRKRYKADPGSKKDSMKAQYWLDPESKETAKAQYWLDPESKKESAKAQYWLDTQDSMKAYYDQNRELILASKQDQYQANPKAKRDISRINSCRKRNPMR